MHHIDRKDSCQQAAKFFMALNLHYLLLPAERGCCAAPCIYMRLSTHHPELHNADASIIVPQQLVYVSVLVWFKRMSLRLQEGWTLLDVRPQSEHKKVKLVDWDLIAPDPMMQNLW